MVWWSEVEGNGLMRGGREMVSWSEVEGNGLMEGDVLVGEDGLEGGEEGRC